MSTTIEPPPRRMKVKKVDQIAAILRQSNATTRRIAGLIDTDKNDTLSLLKHMERQGRAKMLVPGQCGTGGRPSLWGKGEKP